MAVDPRAAEAVDVALDRVAELLTARRPAASSSAFITWALEVAELWRSIADHAESRGDVELYRIAVEQRAYFIEVAIESSPPSATAPP